MKMKRKERYEFFKDYGLPLWVVKDEKDVKVEKCMASIISLIMFFAAYAIDDKFTGAVLISMTIIIHFIGIWR